MVLFLLICIPALRASAERCSERPVTVEHFSIPAEEIYGEIQFDVYIPPCMDERMIGGYPVVYLLHGQDMGIEVWQEMDLAGTIRSTLNEEDVPLFLTVVPQEDNYLLSFSLSGYEDSIMHNLIPWVDAHYNTCKDRRCRSIGGLSRGALWAEKIAFDYPDIFGSVGLLSLPGTYYDDQTLYYIADRTRENYPLRIRFETGNLDNYRHESNKAAAQLTYIGYPYEYSVQQGEHNTSFWQTRLDDFFLWFSQSWKSDQSFLTITQTAE